MIQVLSDINDALVRWVAPLMEPNVYGDWGANIERPIGWLGALGVGMIGLSYALAKPGSSLAILFDKGAA